MKNKKKNENKNENKKKKERRLTVLEYENGFIMPLKQAAMAQGNGAFHKEEIKIMLGSEISEMDLEDVEVVVVQIKKTVNLKEYLNL